MGSRGTRLPRDQRRIQLLDAANDVFTSKGYHAAAMDDIADAAGVSKPVLYQHFPSKLDLYLALLDQSCDRLVEIVEEALASTEHNADRVIATVGAFYEFVSSDSGARAHPMARRAVQTASVPKPASASRAAAS